MIGIPARERALVIGLGRSGAASIEVLRARGNPVVATDEKPAGELSGAIAALTELGASFIPPELLDGVLGEIDFAVLSPGIPFSGPLVRRIAAAGIPVQSEIEMAFRLCAAPIVAVTGTKGKSTTTALTGHLLRAAYGDVRVGGNIGNALVREVVTATPQSWVVAEVSSFQLEAVQAFRPRVSVLLNISDDHLDRYPSIDTYAQAKYRIFANQDEHDVFVGNLDDERLRALHWQTGELRVRARQRWFTIGPEHARADMYLHGETIVYTPATGDPRPVPLFDRREIPLAGAHNLQNAMAAMLAALAAGVPADHLRDAMRTFRAMPHRLEPVGEIGGVRFIDDSKATNPGAAIAALRSFEEPIVLIAGGKSKKTDFAELGAEIDRRAVALVAIGEAAPEIAAHVRRARVERAESMEDAVRVARRLAAPSGVVLLSPACASFDMFASAEHRGEVFTASVRALSEAAV